MLDGRKTDWAYGEGRFTRIIGVFIIYFAVKVMPCRILTLARTLLGEAHGDAELKVTVRPNGVAARRARRSFAEAVGPALLA